MNHQGGRRRGSGPRPAGPRRESEVRTGPPPRRPPDRGVRVREFREPGGRPGKNGQRPPENGPRPVETGPLTEATGVLDLNPQGWGVVRAAAAWNDDPRDAFVSQELIRRFGLRPGQQVEVRTRAANGGSQKRPTAVEVVTIEG